MRRLTHNGVSLKPIQIAEDVLGDLAMDEALEAHVDGKHRDTSLFRFPIRGPTSLSVGTGIRMTDM